MGLAGGNDKILGLILLQHRPHGLYIIIGISPVTFGFKIPDPQLICQPEFNFGDGAGDFKADKT